MSGEQLWRLDMAVWVVRGAKGGTHEQRMLDNDFVSIGFEGEESGIKSLL